MAKKYNSKLIFLVFATVFICGCGLIAYNFRDYNKDETKWVIPTNDSVFQLSKMAVLPWILVLLFSILYKLYFGKLNNLIFLRNNISCVIGLIVYIVSIIISYYVWFLGFDKEKNETFDMLSYVVSVSVGIFVWFLISGFIISRRLDNGLSIFLLLLILGWYNTCSYNECPNIYTKS